LKILVLFSVLFRDTADDDSAVDTGDVDALLFDADDVGAGLDRSELDVEQVVWLVANLTQLRHAARRRHRRLHVQRSCTCS